MKIIEIRRELRKAMGKKLIIKVMANNGIIHFGLSEYTRTESKHLLLGSDASFHWSFLPKDIQSIEVLEMSKTRDLIENIFRFFDFDIGFLWEGWRERNKKATIDFINGEL